MPTSPEAASVVERLKDVVRPDARSLTRFDPFVQLSEQDADVLLAVVEAAKKLNDDAVEIQDGWFVGLATLLKLRHRLDALYTPDSAEPKDAEGAKP